MAFDSIVQFPTALPERYKKFAFAFLFCLAAGSAVVLLFPAPALIVVGMLALLPFAFYVIFELSEGNAEPVMFLWLAIFPLGYYFLSFPRGGSLVTFDRITIALLFLGIIACPLRQMTRVPGRLRRCAWAWSAFLAGGLISLLNVERMTSNFRWFLDAMVIPAFLGWYIVACFPARRYLKPLHAVICVICVYCAAIGAAEMWLGKDLLAIPGAGETLAGQNTLLRVNGPFSSNNSFGLIGLLAFCLLGFLREAVGPKLSRWQRLLHVAGISAAFLQALMPLFRSMFITIGVIFLLDLFRPIGWVRKAMRVLVIGALGAGLVLVMLNVPELFEERVSSGSNIYVRVAQQLQNLRIFMSHPVFGVGFMNFYSVASTKPELSASYNGKVALDFPHNNLAGVLAETGIVGFLPYVLTQLLLVAAFRKVRTFGKQDGRLAWTFFLYIFLSYWINGMALTSGYYSDLNLFFIFCLGTIYKYAISQGTSHYGHSTTPRQDPSPKAMG